MEKIRIRDAGWRNSDPGWKNLDPGRKKFRSVIEKFGSGMEKIRIRDKHPGSDTDCTVNQSGQAQCFEIRIKALPKL
jgi:hypothetical protein